MTNKKITYKPIDPKVQKLAEHHGGTREAALEILRDLDAKNRLNAETITDTARALHIPAHQAYGVATFFSMLSLEERKKILRVCDGPVCWLKRASKTTNDKRQTLIHGSSFVVDGWKDNAALTDYTIERTSCLGLCDRAPAILVEEDQAGPAHPKDAKKVCEGWRGVPMDYSKPRKGELRVMMSRANWIDPDSITDAEKLGAYEGLRAALTKTPADVIAEVEASGLQGRGGAGFPVGRKWKFVAAESRTPRYMICNADESEPLIFKDRVLIDSDPHQLLEGIAIGGYACGASEGWIYIRGEYESQAKRLENAIKQAEKKNFLGEKILGTDFSFKIHVHRGAGAYICGEETALIEALEGKRGEPRLRPPFPPQHGFRGQPTSVNNVESFCAATHIVKNGAEWWKNISGLNGSTSCGTKMYMVLGHVKKPGLFEAPFGLTLRQIIDEFGGGMIKDSKFHFALTGGAAGSIIGKDHLDIPIDFTSSQKGIGLGAGAFLICDQTVSPVAFLRELLHFFAAESCGKCTPCRVGTWRSLEILERMANGEGRKGDIAELQALSDNMFNASFCGLGQSVPIPMNSALKNFAKDFEKAEGR
jgi:NADH:ubiquinone oxidoreductase subunit F (NADH-binding)/NADH:ubiquinone oxidoreductase subunit E